jgi:perosamine synthetase
VDPVARLMTTMHCFDMGRSPGQLVSDWLCGGRAPEPCQGEGQHVVFTQSGRAAVSLAAQIWGIGEKDEVLVPAYQCGSEISPLIATGAQVLLYRVDERARIDIEDLLGRITPRTRVVHVTHYFGRPAELGELVTLCRAQNIRLLEDCALSLFSDATGRAGDAVVYSLRKSLPVPDGGVLLLRGVDHRQFDPTARPALLPIARGALSLVKNWSKNWIPYRSVLHQNGHLDGKTAVKSLLPDMPSSYYWRANSIIRRASRFALGVLKRTDPRAMVRTRRENYSHLRECLTGSAGVGFLWEDTILGETVCPLGLPILVDDRLRWCRGLNAAGVPVSCWWEGYCRGLDWSEFPEARALKDHLILLPVHQGLTVAHMEYVAGVVRSLINS